MTWYSSNNEIPLPPVAKQLLNLPPYRTNSEDVEVNKIKSNQDYRHFLIKNADIISEVNQNSACNECCNCPPVYGDATEKNTVKHIFTGPSDITHAFQQSDLKLSYLLKQQNKIIQENI